MWKSRRIVAAILFMPVVLFFADPNLRAQATGRIGGTVTDQSGAVVPDAMVRCKNLDTGVEREGRTNAAGLFEFPNLPIGHYQLEISGPGFQSQRTDRIELLTGATLDLPVSLKVGDAVQAVTVTAEAPVVESTSSSVQTSVNQTAIRDLPLNGRNPLQLTALTPGTAITDVGTESGQQDNRGLTVNGLRATQNNFVLDGAGYTNRFFDSVPTMPNPDALQEFTIQSSNYSAEYGGAGALVQLSTRSGSNQIHGTAYEFLRNTDLNGRNFFSLSRPPFKLNQYGGTIGGPIVKNRTFFFFSGQDTLQRSAPSPISITVPTAAQRNGDFSALLPKTQLVDPFNNNAPFANNQIPLSRMDPVAMKVAAALLPLPNSGTQYVSFANKNVDDTQYLVKIDHNFTQNNRLSGRYFFDQDNFQRAFNAPNGFFAENLFRNQTAVISDTEVFSPTLTANFSFSVGRFPRTQIPVSPGLQNNQTFGATVPLGTSVPIFPGIRDNISGFVNIFSGGALRQNPTSFEWRTSASKVVGSHQIGFGFSFERARVNLSDYSYTPGDNTFNGQRSGNAVADFFLGAESTFFEDNGRTAYLRESRPALYLQDDWKVSRALTVNVGLRWEPWLPPTDLNHSLVGFVPGAQSTIAPKAPLGLVYPGDSGISGSIFKNDWKDFAPRIGLAWNVGSNNRTVIRAAYGIFYSFPEGLLYQRTDQTQPTDLTINIPNPSSPFSNVYATYPGGSPFPRPQVLPAQFAAYNFILPVSGGVLDPSSRVGYTQNWNLTVQRQVGKDIAVSVAYVGNHGVNVMGSRQFNPALLAPGATVANENSRREYPGLGAVELASSYVYDEFHSLQFNVTKRFSGGFTFLSNFVYGKTIDNTSSGTEGNTGPPNPFNFRSARGPADFDQTYRFNFSGNYVLPRFNVNKAAGYLVNGWQLNAIVTLDSGLPFTVLSGTDRSLSGIGNDYADLIGNPARPAGVSSIQEYFNTAAFAAAAPGTFGTAGRNILRGPNFFDIDMSVFKDFNFTDRWRLQFRSEAFNVENRTNLQNPTATVSSGTFGRITAAYDPRVFQFALKLFF